MVLDRVVSASFEDMRDISPLIPTHYVLDKEDPLLLFSPAVFLNHRV